MSGGWGSGVSRPVSRVLYGPGSLPDVAAIPLGRPSPAASGNQPGRRAWKRAWRVRGHPVSPLFDLAPGGVCRAVRVAASAVRSYRTLSPLPPVPAAVCSLWHCPWGRPRRTLSGTVLPWSPDFPPRSPRGPGAAARPTDRAGLGAKPAGVKPGPRARGSRRLSGRPGSSSPWSSRPGRRPSSSARRGPPGSAGPCRRCRRPPAGRPGRGT